MWRQFIDANARLSARLEPRLESDIGFYRRYDRLVAEAASALPGGSLVVDLGGGRRCSFADAVDRRDGTRIVAVDVSAEELAANASVDETRLADVAEGLPFTDGEVNLLVSRTLLEHVDGVPAAVAEMARVLKPGGRAIHLVPGRYALFALAARLLPFGVAKSLLHRLIPSSRGVIEFDVHYDHCHPAALERLFDAAGFRELDVDCCWSQARYFQWLFPLYALVAIYQRQAQRLGARRLAAYFVVRAAR